MQLFRNLIFLIWFSNVELTAFAQEKKQPDPNINSIFADLPVDIAMKNSILKSNENAQEKISRNVFVKAFANKNVVYLGEPILITYELYTALESKSIISLRPSLTGSGVVDLEVNENLPKQVKMEGKTCRVFNILRLKLNPLQQGIVYVDPIGVDNSVNYIAGDGKTYNYSGSVKSNELRLNILPLPVKNRPKDFSGMVGKFQIRDTVEKSNLPAGEDNNLHIEITGSGEFADINLPAISWPPGFDHFTLRESAIGDKNKFPPSGKKIFDIPFVSSQQGVFTLPSISFFYFDPSRKIYHQVATRPIPMMVTPAVIEHQSKKPVSAVVNPVKSRPDKFLLMLFGSLAALAIGVIIFLKRRFAFKKAKEEKIAREAELLALAEPEVKQTDFRKELLSISLVGDDVHYLELTKSLLTKLLQEKFCLNNASEEELLVYLNQQDKDQSLTRHVGEVYSSCNRLLYSPGGQGSLRSSIADAMTRIIDFVIGPLQGRELDIDKEQQG